jgi:hypothetical protein
MTRTDEMKGIILGYVFGKLLDLLTGDWSFTITNNEKDYPVNLDMGFVGACVFLFVSLCFPWLCKVLYRVLVKLCQQCIKLKKVFKNAMDDAKQIEEQ